MRRALDLIHFIAKEAVLECAARCGAIDAAEEAAAKESTESSDDQFNVLKAIR